MIEQLFVTVEPAEGGPAEQNPRRDAAFGAIVRGGA
jgi:hypothetical protein